MSLRSHVHPDKILAAAREHPAQRLTAEARGKNLGVTSGAYGRSLHILICFIALLTCASSWPLLNGAVSPRSLSFLPVRIAELNIVARAPRLIRIPKYHLPSHGTDAEAAYQVWT